MDERKEIALIFKKFLSHTCSRQEFEILKEYLKKPEAEENIMGMIEEDIELVEKYQVFNEEVNGDDSPLFNKIAHAVSNKEFSRLSEIKSQKSKGRHSWYLVGVLFTVIVMVSWLIYSTNGLKSNQISWLEKRTLPGQKTTITLIDGSTVLLNADSKLIYPIEFGEKREVILEGEAFFMVSRDEQRPFSIKSGKLVTTVLGTSFNIKAFRNENIEVTVATGKVKVSQEKKSETLPDDAKQSIILEPNQQAIYDVVSDDLGKEEVDAHNYLAWREGVLRLDHISFEEASRLLERWYGVKIVLENEQIGNCVIIGGEFQSQSLHKILKTLEPALGISYEFTEEAVVIRGEGCAQNTKVNS